VIVRAYSDSYIHHDLRFFCQGILTSQVPGLAYIQDQTDVAA
jgi:hypothetical protein